MFRQPESDKSLEERGYVVGAIVRQHHTDSDSRYDDFEIIYVHDNGALDCIKDGKVYGLSHKYCYPI